MLKRTLFRSYVLFVALTGPVLLLFGYMYSLDYRSDLKEVYRNAWPAFKKGGRL